MGISILFRLVFVLGSPILLSSAWAQESPVPASPSQQQSRDAELYNDWLRNLPFSNETLLRNDGREVVRPYAEFEPAKFFITAAKTIYGSASIKEQILKKLPESVTAVVYVRNGSEVFAAQQQYSKHISPERLKIAVWPGTGETFWARDAIPVPVLAKPKPTEDGSAAPASLDLAVVDARYYHTYEPDTAVAQFFSLPLLGHPYYHEGGNIIADKNAHCMLVNNVRATKIPDEVFEKQYGCRKVLRFDHLSGIGHIDERIKLLSNSVALTDTPAYREKLEKLGYEVFALPASSGAWETYVNSLLVNSVLFMPIFGRSTDGEAQRVYEELGQKLGFSVVPIRAESLSIGRGNIHCITMTYPAEQTPDETE